jgi:bacillithiol system protein YtxJ
MAWIKLDSTQILNRLLEQSNQNPQLIFKHSTRCSISAMAKQALEAIVEHKDIYLLDVIENRHISNSVAQQLGVVHQSPQLLLLQNGTCRQHVSHMNISAGIIDQFTQKRD